MNCFYSRQSFSLSSLKFFILAFMLFVVSSAAQAADTIKVGILHSLSGTMAISETSLKDVALMAIEEINAKGGLLGKKHVKISDSVYVSAYAIEHKSQRDST